MRLLNYSHQCNTVMKIIDNKLCRENKSHFKLNEDAKTKFNTKAEAVVK